MMKKLLIFCILILVFMFCSCDKKELADVPQPTDDNNSIPKIVRRQFDDISQAEREIRVETGKHDSPAIAEVLQAYSEFLSGKRSGDWYGDKILIKNDCLITESLPDIEVNRYVLLDMSGDDVPELVLTCGMNHYLIILTLNSDKQLCKWYLGKESRVLNDGGIFYENDWWGIQMRYGYDLLNSKGHSIYSIAFTKCDRNEDGIYDDKVYRYYDTEGGTFPEGSTFPEGEPWYYETQDEYYFDDIKVAKELWDKLTDRYFKIGDDQIKWKPYIKGEAPVLKWGE